MSLALYGGITMKNGAIEQENFRGGGRIVRIGESAAAYLGRSRGERRPAWRRGRTRRSTRRAGDRECDLRAFGKADSRTAAD